MKGKKEKERETRKQEPGSKLILSMAKKIRMTSESQFFKLIKLQLVTSASILHNDALVK